MLLAHFQDSQIMCGFADECPPGLTCLNGLCRNGNGGGNEFPLTVTLGGNGAGAVTSSPAGIDCGATCSEQFAPGTMVTLTATPDKRIDVRRLDRRVRRQDVRLVTVDAATTVTANFALENSVIVVLGGDGSGNVISMPAGIDCGA